ncbi:MAG: tRNA pseudouridine(38-40) synthase TruA [Candidatus Omnitrophica bacterium]|nr:tRNA pseudouridine(38-40) synthase TruA [Candidatus Omnitrophota bacterium]
MRNIKLTIRYDGTSYSGWQFQKNSSRTIQAVIERAIKKITGEKSHLTGSGRTDAGVHAMAQVANFRTRSSIPLKNIHMALNSLLPEDIVIYRVEEAKAGFDAQRDAKSKIYRYTIMNADFMDPFLRLYAAKIFYTMDIGRMRQAAKWLIGRHDFRAFQATDGAEKNSVRTVRKIDIKKEGDLIYINIEADGFLYNMARNIVGTLVEVGRGKFSVESVKDILRARDRRRCGPTMPAKGLCLIKVKY